MAARRQPRAQKAIKIGLSAQEYLDKRDARLQKNCSVVDAWSGLLPVELYDHCKLAGIAGGVLRIEAEPGPYMHQVRMISGELLEHLQNRCWRAGIKKIVVVAGRSTCRLQAASEDERP